MLACQVIKDQDPLVSATLLSSARRLLIAVIYNSGCSHCCNWKRTLLLSGGRHSALAGLGEPSLVMDSQNITGI